MSSELDRLDPYDDDSVLRVVVEAPRGASVKLKYDPDLRTFTVARQLPLGLEYPFPGTLGEDGRSAGRARAAFLSATLFTGKNARIRGWRGAKKATALIERGRRSLQER
jgi:inorganic pyrophosphatase